MQDLEAHPFNWVVNSARKSATLEEGSSVDEVMTRHAGERGVIHTTSYQ